MGHFVDLLIQVKNEVTPIRNYNWAKATDITEPVNRNTMLLIQTRQLECHNPLFCSAKMMVIPRFHEYIRTLCV